MYKIAFALACLVVLAAAAPSYTVVQPRASSVVPMGREMAHGPLPRRSRAYDTRASSQSVLDDPLGGNIWPVAIYWVFVEVGTPPVRFPAAVDSGSDTLDIPFYDCPSCVKTSPNTGYNPANSSTSKAVDCNGFCQCTRGQCSFRNSYQTCDLNNPSAVCTISGFMYEDQVTIGGASGSAAVEFGVINYQTSNFQQFAVIDGVVGLAGPGGNQNVFSSLFKAGYVKKDMFGMCFVEGSTSNGTFTIGGTDPRLYTGDIKYVPNAGFSSGYYGFTLGQKGIAVGTQTVDNTAGATAILDSGTNVLLLPQSMFSSFQTLLQAGCDGANPLPGVCGTDGFFGGKCMPLTAAEMARFPTLTVWAADDLPLSMPPKSYLLLGENPAGYCLGVRNTGVDGLFIVGDTTMEQYYVVFDRADQQIGWAPVNAQNCGSL